MRKFFLLVNITLFVLGCGTSDDTAPDGNLNTLPFVSITQVSNITSAKANSGGNVSDDGGATVSSKGICWHTSPNPTINNNITSNGQNIGVFVSEITGLEKSTTYYVRAYATNSVGTAYSNQLSFTTPACNNGFYNGNLSLSTQKEVEEFATECYIGINGFLTINSNVGTTDEITDLSSLSHLVTISNSLNIGENPKLPSLDGLENITSVGDLNIQLNASLTSITALSNLEEITSSGIGNNGNGPGVHINNNAVLTSIDGLEKIKILGGLSIKNNPLLNSIRSLNNVTKLLDALDISGNDNLESLDGLSGITSIATFCYIINNPKITSLDALNNIESIGALLRIENNDKLISISGLENLNSVDGIIVNNNPELINLNGLPNLELIGNSLSIRNNDSLIDLEGIDGVSINGWLNLDLNSSLTSINQLSNLTTVGTFNLSNCNAINSLTGLENLVLVNEDLQIFNNSQLNDFCALTNLDENGSVVGAIIIQDNAFNPGLFHLFGEGCSN